MLSWTGLPHRFNNSSSLTDRALLFRTPCVIEYSGQHKERYAQACSSYECFVLRVRRLSSKLLIGIPRGTLENVIQDVLWSIRGSYSAKLNYILTLDQLQWLPYSSDFSPIEWPWCRAWHSAFATAVAYQQGTLTLPGTWFVPSGSCSCSNCWYQFSRTCLVFPRLFTMNIPRYFLDFAYFILPLRNYDNCFSSFYTMIHEVLFRMGLM